MQARAALLRRRRRRAQGTTQLTAPPRSLRQRARQRPLRLSWQRWKSQHAPAHHQTGVGSILLIMVFVLLILMRSKILVGPAQSLLRT